MPKARSIEIAEINIAMHPPHSADQYESLLRTAYRMTQSVTLGKVHAAMIGSLYRREEKGGTSFITGEIYRYVSVDSPYSWFNAQRRTAATAEEVEQINIPPHLIAHIQRFPFLFNLNRHRFHYICRDKSESLSPTTAVRFLTKLFDKVRTEHDYPQVEVTPVPDSETVDRILSIPNLKKLTIEMVMPNPDDGASDEARFKRRLQRQNARKQVIHLIASENKTLEPDDEMRRLAQVAANNGKVIGLGKTDGGKKIEETTTERPSITVVPVEDENESTMQVLKRTARVG